MDARFEAVRDVVERYFEGLYDSDTAKLAEVFHQAARYICATGGGPVDLGMEEYFKIIDNRPSPASPEPLNGRIVSIEFAGPSTAVVRAECRIAPKDFTDFLVLILVEGRWQIISKVFHYDLREQTADKPA